MRNNINRARQNSVGSRSVEKRKGPIERLKEYDFKKIILYLVIILLAVKGTYDIGEDVLERLDISYYQNARQELANATVYAETAYDNEGNVLAATENDFYYDINQLIRNIKEKAVYDNGRLDQDEAAKRIVELSMAMQAKDPTTAEANINKVIAGVYLGSGNFKNLDDIAKSDNFKDRNALFKYYEEILRAEAEKDNYTIKGGK